MLTSEVVDLGFVGPGEWLEATHLARVAAPSLVWTGGP
jgi:hypothetical protein